MTLDFGLKNAHVLISGAAGGIGLAAVDTFLQLGATVTAHYNTGIGQLGSREGVASLQADVRNEQDIQHLFARAAEHKGRPVTTLIVNHGIWPKNDAPLVDMDLSQWSNTLSVNLTGAFLLCREYLKALQTASDAEKACASIIFIGSTAGKYGEAGHGDYAASKSALMYGLLPTLKNEIVRIAPQGRVNCVSPGWVATPMAQETLKDVSFVERALATTPLQKVASPEDVARQIAVLASPILSGHVTGQNIMVEGGFEGRLLFPPRSST